MTHPAWAKVPQELREQAYDLYTSLPERGPKSAVADNNWHEYRDTSCCPFGALNLVLAGDKVDEYTLTPDNGTDLDTFLNILPTAPTWLLRDFGIGFADFEDFIGKYDHRELDLAEAMGVAR